MKSQHSTYSEKLKDPRWQKKRLEVLEAAGWKCHSCGAADKELQVHHPFYEKGKEPWEYDNLVALCDGCHETITGASKVMSQALSLMNHKNAARIALAFSQVMERGTTRGGKEGVNLPMILSMVFAHHAAFLVETGSDYQDILSHLIPSCGHDES